MDLFTFLNRQKRWSRNTFPTANAESVLKHMEKEIAELRECGGKDVAEWADVVILALDGAWRSGFTPAQICRAIEQKQATNMAREWPKPEDQVPGEPVEHVRQELSRG